MAIGSWGRRDALRLAAAAALGLPTTARAQGGRSVARLVVPYAPGGTTDVTARLLSNRIAEGLGQTWVIENRSGANGAIGAQDIARAAPDGLNLLYSNEVHLVLKFVQRGVPFDALADFTPIVRTVRIPYVLVGGANHIRQPDAKALLAAVKREPNRFTFAGSTLGSVGQLGAAALGQKLGTEFTIVAYRGSGPAVNDLVSGAVSLMFAPLGAVQPLIESGQLKAFAVTATERVPLLPEVPTMVELGYPEMVFEGWTGIWGPRRLPAEKVAAVHDATAQALRDPEIVQRLAALGCAPIVESSEDFSRLTEREQARNGEIARAAGIRPE
ncbi:tripartite tricarboxylate transporter substrate binding protein [Pseudoroseomonas wenyumeiae]|uniref:Tripartite tricarboxylate transporter substrate binding protein n=1 Tax=Teichococcus wenyumeiae TaxID=2478470 RepID=A0A3A9JD11_9PROT|nr:tripartite tricarboxylate transporter substrate binding protein [Pseudoroseomonas wenyumeiae]RKK04050.1 tripartite tricarboxylate transporter substrate binding protein [Pseudoroseomonas wenyumeiae]RMI20226.1 tripartite tricarboxylate transporter substrate binding protein [Pseudoroseomonas wenyumeiae]